MALTRAQIQTAFQNSLGRAASQSEEDSYFSVSQSGALPDATIYTTISNSQEANLISDPVVRFYQAVFGRVPDQAGLDNTQDFIRANGASAATYQNLATQFAQSPEFTARFGSGTTVDAGYVQALYTTILGRQASAAEINGFTSGSNGYTTRGGVLYAISQSQEAISISDNAVNGFLNNAAQGQAVYTGTLYTPANGQPNVPGAPITNLTTGVDNIPGTSGTDIINGVIDVATPANSTFTVADTINGGPGTDNLNVILTGANGGVNAAVPLANVTNVENFFIRNLTTGAGVATFDAASITGEQQVWNDRSSGAISVTGLATGATIGVRGDATNNVGATTFTYANATDAVTIAIDGGVKVASAAAIEIQRAQTGATDITINSTGAANTVGVIDLDNTANPVGTIKAVTINATTDLTARLSAGDFAANSTLKLAGAGAIAINGATLAANVTTIDASGNTGGVNVRSSNVADITFTGGSGDDTLRLDGTLTSADKINGGAGTDTVRITGGDLTLAANEVVKGINALQSVEQIVFASTPGATTIDQDVLTNSQINKLIFRTAGADTINNADTRIYAIAEDNAGASTFNAKVGVTTLNLEIVGDDDNPASSGVVTANGQSTVNINLAGEDVPTITNAFTQLNLATNATVNVTGDGNFAIGGVKTVAGADFASGTPGVIINASTLEGKFSVIGSVGNDVITGGAGNDTIIGTAGGGNITGALNGQPEIQAVNFATASVANNETVTVTIGANTATYTNTSGATVTGAGLVTALTAALNGTPAFAAGYTAAPDTTPTTLTLTQNTNFSDVGTATIGGTGITGADAVTVATRQNGSTAITQAAGPGADILTGGGGNDTFVFVNNSTSTALIPRITDLNLGTDSANGSVDIVAFQQAGGTGVAGTGVTIVTLTAVQQTAVSGAASLTAAVNGLLNTGPAQAQGSVVQFTYGSDTYLLHSGNATANNDFQTTDHIVKITGATGTLNASDVVLFAGA